jgi:hypothetical protein
LGGYKRAPLLHSKTPHYTTQHHSSVSLEGALALVSFPFLRVRIELGVASRALLGGSGVVGSSGTALVSFTLIFYIKLSSLFKFFSIYLYLPLAKV